MLCGLAASAIAEAPPAMQATDAPATTDGLSQRIKDYQAAKNCDGMIGLFYDEGNDKSRRQVMSDTIRDYVCANFKRKISSIAFQAVAPDKLKAPGDYEGTPSMYTLPPEGVVVIDYGNGKPGEAKSLSFLYGEHDHKLYLITTKKADAK